MKITDFHSIGRFQYFASVILTLAFISGSFCGQSLQFLMLAPHYECSFEQDFKTVFTCAPRPKKEIPGFCDAAPGTIYHRVNYTSDESLDNWFEQIELACATKAEIGLVGSLQFVGWALASAILPRLADIYGRKYIVVGSLTLQLLGLIATFFSYNLYLS